jgi:CHAT domain-containing protein
LIAKAYEGREIECDTLLDVQRDATFLEVARRFRFGKYDLIHFAGHAWYDGRDAYLKLQDQDVMRSGEFDIYLRQCPPAMMILNSHFTAFVPPGIRERSFDPLTNLVLRRQPSVRDEGHRGFISIAETTGVGALIGCMTSIDDEYSADFGLKLHEELLAGLPIGRALREARRSCLEARGKSPIPFSYTLSGHAGLALRVSGVRPLERTTQPSPT